MFGMSTLKGCSILDSSFQVLVVTVFTNCAFDSMASCLIHGLGMCSTEQGELYGDRTAGFHGYSHLTGGFDGGQAEWARVPFGRQWLIALLVACVFCCLLAISSLYHALSNPVLVLFARRHNTILTST